jgi:hypothetical protein
LSARIHKTQSATPETNPYLAGVTFFGGWSPQLLDEGITLGIRQGLPSLRDACGKSQVYAARDDLYWNTMG